MGGGLRFTDFGGHRAVCDLCRPTAKRLILFKGFALPGGKRGFNQQMTLELFMDLCYDAHDTGTYALLHKERYKDVKGIRK